MIGELVKGYLERFPELPTNTLAKKIYSEHSDKFTDKEHARSQVRYYRGTSGDELRAKLKDKRFVDQQPIYKYNIPENDELDFSPFHLPAANNNILVMSDIHIPYHAPKSIELAIDWGLSHGINTIVLNGDIIDFYGLSRFTKDPTFRRPKAEIEMLRQFLHGISQIPNVKVYYKYGNHEERYENYLKVKAPELFDMDEYKLNVILHLGEYGIEWVGNKRMVMAGKLPILHGHEFNGIGATVNPARGLYLKTKQSAVIGHLHTSSEHNEPNMSGELFTTWSLGCLCHLKPEYAPYNKWNHGFMHVKVSSDGNFRVFNARIYDGKVL